MNDDRSKDRPPETNSAMVHLARFSGHGLTLALSTGLFLMAGWWVDGKLGTRPLFALIGALLGAAGGLYSMVQHLLLMPRKDSESKPDSTREEDGGP
jgi:ATP synthase protein I